MSELFKKNVKIKSSFIGGFGASFASFKFIRKNKSILFFYIIPFLLNILILSLLLYLAWINIFPFLKNHLTGDAWYFTFLKPLLVPILLIFLFFITTVVYGFIGNILCSPFLNALSQKTQEIISGKKNDKPLSLKDSLEDFTRTFKNFFKMFFVIIIVYILSLFLLLIPLIGAMIYSMIGYFITSFILGLQFLDYPLDRRKYTFKEKLKIVWKFKYSTIGLGISYLIVSMIPIFGFLGINMCIMGASSIFEKNISPALSEYKIS